MSDIRIESTDTPTDIDPKMKAGFSPIEAMLTAYAHVFRDHDQRPVAGCELCEADSE